MSGSAAFPAPASSAAGLLRHAGALCARYSILHLARQAVFLAAVLVAWVSLKPYGSLSGLDREDITTGTETATYLVFAALAAASLALSLIEHRRALIALLTPATVALGLWLCLNSVLFSQDAATSVKRLTLTFAVFVLTACLPLLPRSRHELGGLLALGALGLLALCYVGLVVAPALTIHQPNDIPEPQLAGNWRGTFGHKNLAAAVMGMMLFVGVAVFRTGWRLAGAAIVVLAAIFLIGCGGKSSIALSVTVFALTGLFALVRSLQGRAVLALGPVLLLNLFSLGTVLSDGLARLVAALPVDATFTGRTEIWRFAVDAVGARPLAGYGFSAFWNSQWVRDVAEGEGSWAGYASHSHNGYLDTVLTLGAIGFVLTLAVFVIGPLRDYQRAEGASAQAAPIATLFLQIWLFCLLLAGMESFFYDRSDPIWFTFLIAVFGLRYLGRFRTR